MVKTAKKDFHPQKRPNHHPEAKRVKIQAFQAKRSPEKGDLTISQIPKRQVKLTRWICKLFKYAK
jgi:hypothetical protein